MKSSAEGSVIELTGDVRGFFGDLFDDAARARGYEPTGTASQYVVAVLAHYARPDALSAEALDRPLTLLLDDALHAAGQERFDRLRSLGDSVLYTSGFFSGHLETRGVEVEYVHALGARAYCSAADMLRGRARHDAVPDLFSELADGFAHFVRIVEDVSDGLRARSARTERALVALYERWLKTGSSLLSGELAARGLVPLRGTGSIH